MRESEGIKGFIFFSLISVKFGFEIQYISAASVPTNSSFDIFLYGIGDNFHSFIVKGIRFCEINDIEFHRISLSHIFSAKKKPLSVTPRIIIILKK